MYFFEQHIYYYVSLGLLFPFQIGQLCNGNGSPVELFGPGPRA